MSKHERDSPPVTKQLDALLSSHERSTLISPSLKVVKRTKTVAVDLAQAMIDAHARQSPISPTLHGLDDEEVKKDTIEDIPEPIPPERQEHLVVVRKKTLPVEPEARKDAPEKKINEQPVQEIITKDMTEKKVPENEQYVQEIIVFSQSGIDAQTAKLVRPPWLAVPSLPPPPVVIGRSSTLSGKQHSRYMELKRSHEERLEKALEKRTKVDAEYVALRGVIQKEQLQYEKWLTEHARYGIGKFICESQKRRQQRGLSTYPSKPEFPEEWVRQCYTNVNRLVALKGIECVHMESKQCSPFLQPLVFPVGIPPPSKWPSPPVDVERDPMALKLCQEHNISFVIDKEALLYMCGGSRQEEPWRIPFVVRCHEEGKMVFVSSPLIQRIYSRMTLLQWYHQWAIQHAISQQWMLVYDKVQWGDRTILLRSYVPCIGTKRSCPLLVKMEYFAHIGEQYDRVHDIRLWLEAHLTKNATPLVARVDTLRSILLDVSSQHTLSSIPMEEPLSKGEACIAAMMNVKACGWYLWTHREHARTLDMFRGVGAPPFCTCCSFHPAEDVPLMQLAKDTVPREASSFVIPSVRFTKWRTSEPRGRVPRTFPPVNVPPQTVKWISVPLYPLKERYCLVFLAGGCSAKCNERHRTEKQILEEAKEQGVEHRVSWTKVRLDGKRKHRKRKKNRSP